MLTHGLSAFSVNEKTPNKWDKLRTWKETNTCAIPDGNAFNPRCLWCASRTSQSCAQLFLQSIRRLSHMFQGHSSNSKLCIWATIAFSWSLRKFKERFWSNTKKKGIVYMLRSWSLHFLLMELPKSGLPAMSRRNIMSRHETSTNLKGKPQENLCLSH